jgi:acetolactate synthase-1/2/3 large subunit
VITIVFAEGSWTMEEPNELALYQRTFGCEQGETRWDRVAEGLGCHGEYVDRLDQLVPALERSRESARPAVICLRTDRDANRAIPPGMAARWKEIQAGPLPEA